jgi:hypothetical protein
MKMVVTKPMLVFLVVMSCGLVADTNVSEEPTGSIFGPEDEGSMFLG